MQVSDYAKNRVITWSNDFAAKGDAMPKGIEKLKEQFPKYDESLKELQDLVVQEYVPIAIRKADLWKDVSASALVSPAMFIGATAIIVAGISYWYMKSKDNKEKAEVVV